MRSIRYRLTDTVEVQVYGNGTAIALYDVGEPESFQFFQGDDASQFMTEIEAVDKLHTARKINDEKYLQLLNDIVDMYRT